eukprot:s4840_g7.t1
MAPSHDALPLPHVRNSYYAIMSIPWDASEEEIRRTYHSLMREFHPDKGGRRIGGAATAEHFHEVQSAYRCLSHPTRRLQYDLRTFGRSSIAVGSEGEELLVRCKEQAEIDLRNMEVQLRRILQEERKVKGLVVTQALYGNLQLREEILHEALVGDRPIRGEDLVGPWIDVTPALQCLVEEHRIILHGGVTASKVDLPGVYNPLPLDSEAELSLYVQYQFQDATHEVTVGDRQPLSMPLRTHLVAKGTHPRGPFASSNADLLMHRRQREAIAPRLRLLSPEEALQKVVQAHLVWRLHGQPGDVSKREYRLALSTCALAAAMALFFILR